MNYLDKARTLGTSDKSYARAALTSYTTNGARETMIRMARQVLGIDYDPPAEIVDFIADAYWEGVGA